MGITESVERRIKLHDLRLLMCVAEEGSMSKAAERLGTSQPAISRAMSEFEQTLGVQLLERGPRGVLPTPYGQALLRRGLAIFDELRSGIKELEFLADPTAGEVRIAAPLATTGFVSAVIDKLNQHYPRVVCHLKVGEASTVFPLLENRQVDVAIAFLTNEVPAERMDAEVLFPTEPLVVVASTTSRWTRRRKIKLADLIDEPWTLISQPWDYASAALNAFRSAGLDPPTPKVVATSIPARLALVARGRFLTISSEPLLRFAGEGLPIKALPITLPPAGLPPIGLVMLKNRTLTPVAQLFIDCAREVAKPLNVKRR